jgi:hypothetical protein
MNCPAQCRIALDFFVQKLYKDEYVWSHAMPHNAGQNIAMDKLFNFGLVLYDLKEQSIKKSFIGDFPYIIPIKQNFKNGATGT